MGGLLGVKQPKVPAAPTVPSEDPAAKAAAENAAAIEVERRKRGLASTILTSPQGVTSSGNAANTLLGQG